MSMSFLGPADPEKMFGDITGSNQSAKGAESAAAAQIGYAHQANDLLKSLYGDQSAMLEPYRTAGGGALNALMAYSGMNPDGSVSNAPVNYSVFQNSPGYKFGLDQGLQGVQRGLAAQGMTGSGAALKDLNNYAQGYANQNFNNFYNRLAGIAGMGQQAAGMTANYASNYGNQASNNLTGMGNAQASADIARGNVAAQNFNNLMKMAGTFMGGGGTGSSYGGGQGGGAMGGGGINLSSLAALSL